MSNNQLSVFNFEESTPIRTVTIDNVTWFVGKDVSQALGYTNPTKAMNDHCRGITKRYPIVDNLGRRQEIRILSEADVMRLICGSKLPAAQKFERWVFEEVLPAIRKTGRYDIRREAEKQPDAPLNSASAVAGRFSMLRYHGVEVIPGDELRRRLGITKGKLSAWLYSYRPMIDGVDFFHVNGVTDKLAIAMLKAGYAVNPNIITVNLFTRSGFAKAAARFSVSTVPIAAEPPIPRLPSGNPPELKMKFCLNDVMKPFKTATGALLKKLYDAGYNTERELAELVFMSGAIRRMREITMMAGEQIEAVTAHISVKDCRVLSDLNYEDED